MSLQFDELVEGLLAVGALVGPLLGVGRPDVVGQVAAGLEPLVTVITLQPGPAVSTGNVVPGGCNFDILTSTCFLTPLH